MRIAIIGAGSVGTRLGALANAAGHDVTYGVRGDTAPAGFAKAAIADAIVDADLVVLAVPFTACSGLLPVIAQALAGKIVIDVTNPLNTDWSPLLLGEVNSAAQTIAALVPEARVVKAFNTIFADVMTPERLVRGSERITAFIAGDNTEARETVARFAAGIGFAPRIVGTLSLARYLEGMAHLNIAIALGQAGGTNAAFLYNQQGS